jgi:MtN3 and saliva related transmembrane protein
MQSRPTTAAGSVPCEVGSAIDHMFVTNLIGYLAAVVGTVLMLPQVIRSWRTREMHDVSLGMVWLYVANCGLWLTYGLLADLRPVWLTNGAALAISLVQLWLKLRSGPARLP